MSVLQDPVLILNRNFTPVTVMNVEDVITKVFIGTMQFVDEDNYTTYDWETWETLPVGDKTFIRLTRDRKARAPKVAMAINYRDIPIYEIQYSKRNVYLRDRVCQYTGDIFPIRDGSVDHVVPTSRGGGNDWQNVVWTSKRLNHAKGDKTPEEMGLKLIRKPFKPSWSPLFARRLRSMPDEWMKFLRDSDVKLMRGMQLALAAG